MNTIKRRIGALEALSGEEIEVEIVKFGNSPLPAPQIHNGVRVTCIRAQEAHHEID